MRAPLAAAIQAKDLVSSLGESAPDERHFAPVTREAIRVPVTILERDELRSSKPFTESI